MTYQFISTLFVCYTNKIIFIQRGFYSNVDYIYDIFIQSKTQHRYHIFPMLAYLFFRRKPLLYNDIACLYWGL